MQADLIAKRLIHYRKAQGKEWRQWAMTEIGKLSQAYQQPVKDRLNELLKPGAANADRR